MSDSRIRRASAPYRQLLQQALSCVSRSHIAIVYSATECGLLLAGGEQEVLQGSEVALRVMQRYKLREGTRSARQTGLTLVAYSYAIEIPGDAEVEILNFHWDQTSRENVQGRPVTYPHIHVHPRDRRDPLVNHKIHIPSGIVHVEDVIRLAIEEYGAQSLIGTPATFDSETPEWRKLLARTRQERERLGS